MMFEIEELRTHSKEKTLEEPAAPTSLRTEGGSVHKWAGECVNATLHETLEVGSLTSVLSPKLQQFDLGLAMISTHQA
eukprot:924305-Amphidinium_carterae.1